MLTLEDFKSKWTNSISFHKETNELFIQLVNNNKWLKEYRDFVDSRCVGMGERSFAWLFHLLVNSMPNDFKLFEVGVHRGAVLGLVAGLASIQNKKAICIGCSPLDGTNMNVYRDYTNEIYDFFNYFTNNDILQKLHLVKGLSQTPSIIEKCKEYAPFDAVYLDGGHEYDEVILDILNYAPMVKLNGYLLTDDSANSFPQPFGYFCGIDTTSKAVDELLPPHSLNKSLPTGEEYIHIGNVVHLRLFQRIK